MRFANRQSRDKEERLLNLSLRRLCLKLSTKMLRRISCIAATTACFAVLSTATKADSIPTPSAPRTMSLLNTMRLRLHHLHTGESIDVAYKTADGSYDPGAVAMLNHFLRDHRTDENADYDPLEFDLLHNILVRLGRPNAVIDIVCGYRSPESNDFLRTRSAETGVAEHSQHMLSKAIDIRIPGVSTLALRNAALSLGMGGVGYYPISHFVHVDVGPVREWQFGGGRRLMAGLRGRMHGRGGRHGRRRV